SIDPPYLYPDYRSTVLRAPRRPLVQIPPDFHVMPGPAFGRVPVGELDHDLTRQHDGQPLGERIIVSGRVLDGDGRPVSNTLVEVWQGDAAGRHPGPADPHPAPPGPHLTGAGRRLACS